MPFHLFDSSSADIKFYNTWNLSWLHPSPHTPPDVLVYYYYYLSPPPGNLLKTEWSKQGVKFKFNGGGINVRASVAQATNRLRPVTS